MEFKTFESETHELVVVAFDDTFQACVAVHSTALGPALGGIRLRAYGSYELMVIDALKLSEGMSYKNACAGIPFGGGKSTINAAEWTDEIAEKFSRVLKYVNEIKGVPYIGAPDMNTNNDCMKDLKHDNLCDFVFYEPNGGDCSLVTAYGVFQALQAVKSFRSSDDFTVNIEGLGKVGTELTRLCVEEGWDVCISDIDMDRAIALAGYHSCAAAAPSDIRFLKGVYAPCAIGGTCDREFVTGTEAYAVCGAANNQFEAVFANEIDALLARDILVVPDFIANAGGVIAIGVGVEQGLDNGFGLNNPDTLARTEFIRHQVSSLLMAQESSMGVKNPYKIAVGTAKQVMESVDGKGN